MSNKKYLLLQINDALFPIGAYSHSFGLETFIQKNLVYNYDTAFNYIRNKLNLDILYSELLPIKLAYKYCYSNNLDKIIELEEILEASRIPSEIRAANNKLGSRFIKTILNLDITYDRDMFNRYVNARKGHTVNYAIAYGVFCASCNIELNESIERFIYSQTSAIVTNCVKTIPLSQSEGQKLLTSCHIIFEYILSKLNNIEEDMLCLSTTSFDIRCIEHEALYSRLYMS